MESFNERLRKKMESVTYCVAKPGGQGFVDKSECTCDKDKCPCQAMQDAERFYAIFEEVTGGDFNKRPEAIKVAKKELKDSQWFRDNVTE